MEFLLENYGSIIGWVLMGFVVASFIATFTPSGKDDSILAKIGNFADNLGLNLANWRPKMPKQLDGIPINEIITAMEKHVKDKNDSGAKTMAHGAATEKTDSASG